MFNQLRNSIKCCLSHIEATPPDTLGLRFVLLNCTECQDKNFCLSIKRVIEEELNKRSETVRILGRRA